MVKGLFLNTSDLTASFSWPHFGSTADTNITDTMLLLVHPYTMCDKGSGVEVALYWSHRWIFHYAVNTVWHVSVFLYLCWWGGLQSIKAKWSAERSLVKIGEVTGLEVFQQTRLLTDAWHVICTLCSSVITSRVQVCMLCNQEQS